MCSSNKMYIRKYKSTHKQFNKSLKSVRGELLIIDDSTGIFLVKNDDSVKVELFNYVLKKDTLQKVKYLIIDKTYNKSNILFSKDTFLEKKKVAILVSRKNKFKCLVLKSKK